MAPGSNASSSSCEPNELSTKIASWFIESGIPLNAANHKSFKTMIEAIARYGPGMEPPTQHELRVTFLKKAVKSINNKVTEHKKEWARKGCSILSDGWHVLEDESDIVSFMVNSPKGSVFMKSSYVSTAPKDACFLLVKIFDAMVDDVGEDNVTQIVTSAAPAYAHAGKKLQETRNHLYWTPCVAHCLELMLEDIGKQVPRVKSCLKKAIFANGYIQSYVGPLNLTRMFTKQMDLHKPAITRFATSFITLYQFYMLKHVLRRMVVSDEWVNSKWSKDPMCKKVESIFLHESFWRDIAYSLKLTGPLIRLLRSIVGEINSPMSYIYKALDGAKEKIQKNVKNKKELYEKTFGIIDHRWECQLDHPLHVAGYYLNPSIFYDDADRILSDQAVMGGLYSCIERLSRSPEDEDKIHGELSIYQNAEGIFGRNVAVRQRKQKTPAEWWVSYGSSAPNLQQFAIRVLSLTCSSISVEKDWAILEDLHTKRRSVPERKRWKDVVYVKFNRALERRHRNKGTIDPILLQDIDDGNEWLLGKMEDDEDNDEVVDDLDDEDVDYYEDDDYDDDLALIGDDFTQGDVARDSGEPSHITKASKVIGWMDDNLEDNDNEDVKDDHDDDADDNGDDEREDDDLAFTGEHKRKRDYDEDEIEEDFVSDD